MISIVKMTDGSEVASAATDDALTLLAKQCMHRASAQ